MAKYLPKIGEKLFLYQSTGDCWIDSVHRPFTVVDVKPNSVIVQGCHLIFDGPRYFDSLPSSIEEDPYGELRTLHWSNKNQLWQDTSRGRDYPYYASFGKWDYYPYLN